MHREMKITGIQFIYELKIDYDQKSNCVELKCQREVMNGLTRCQ